MPSAKIVGAIRERYPDVQAIYLFGSRADKTHGPESDYDIALLRPAPIDPIDRWNLQEDLARQLHASVDLVDLRRAGAVMRTQVIANAQVLYDGDPSARAFFEMTALSSYARLNEERRGILDDIRQRAKIYG